MKKNTIRESAKGVLFDTLSGTVDGDAVLMRHDFAADLSGSLSSLPF